MKMKDEYPLAMFTTEKQVLDELGLKDFRNPGKETIINLFNLAHRMTPELRANLYQQIPALAKIAADTV